MGAVKAKTSMLRLKIAAAASLLQPSSSTNSAKKTEKDRRMPKIMQRESALAMTIRAALRRASPSDWIINQAASSSRTDSRSDHNVGFTPYARKADTALFGTECSMSFNST